MKISLSELGHLWSSMPIENCAVYYFWRDLFDDKPILESFPPACIIESKPCMEAEYPSRPPGKSS